MLLFRPETKLKTALIMSITKIHLEKESFPAGILVPSEV